MIRRGVRAQPAPAGPVRGGVPSYDNYLDHMRRAHPGAAVMSYPEFFRDRQAARFGGKGKGGFRCC